MMRGFGGQRRFRRSGPSGLRERFTSFSNTHEFVRPEADAQGLA